jgi:hypothetical protein
MFCLRGEGTLFGTFLAGYVDFFRKAIIRMAVIATNAIAVTTAPE